MTHLVVDELKTSIIQTFKINIYERQKVQAIRINLLIFNTPSGDLRLNVKKDSTIIATKSIPISTLIDEAELKTGNSHPYYHGYFKFEFDQMKILEQGEHELELLGENSYTFSEFNYIGWIQDHEALKNTTTDPDNVVHAFDYPHGFELWGYRLGAKQEY